VLVCTIWPLEAAQASVGDAAAIAPISRVDAIDPSLYWVRQVAPPSVVAAMLKIPPSTPATSQAASVEPAATPLKLTAFWGYRRNQLSPPGRRLRPVSMARG
jgi:hypothetical protein